MDNVDGAHGEGQGTRRGEHPTCSRDIPSNAAEDVKHNGDHKSSFTTQIVAKEADDQLASDATDQGGGGHQSLGAVGDQLLSLQRNGSAHRSSDPYVDVFKDLDNDVDDVQGVATDELGQAGDDDITDIVVSRRLFLLFGNDDLSWLLGSNYRLFRHVLASTNALQRQQKNVMSLFFTILFCSDLCVDSPGS